MRKRMDEAFLKTKLAWEGKAEEFVKQFLEEEEGDTNIVSIIVIIAIVIFVAAIFRDQLEVAVKQVFNNLTNFLNNTQAQ